MCYMALVVKFKLYESNKFPIASRSYNMQVLILSPSPITLISLYVWTVY